MAELNETKIRALIRLVNRGKITTADIKDPDYQTEVESRLN